MECPNCGKRVRSKTQCAHCGYVFGTKLDKPLKETQKPKEEFKAIEREIKRTQPTPPTIEEKVTEETRKIDFAQPFVEETEEVEEGLGGETVVFSREGKGPEWEPSFIDEPVDRETYDYVPETPKKRSGVGAFALNLVKLIIAVGLVFLAFFYGPNLVRQATNYFGANRGKDTASMQVIESEDDETLTDEEGSEEETGIKIASEHVNLDDYPVIEVEVTFNEPLKDVSREQFKLELGADGSEEDITEQASLRKEGDKLIISYTDPSLDVLSNKPQEQTLTIKADAIDLNQQVSYERPAHDYDQAKVIFFNETIGENFASGDDVSALFFDVRSKSLPLTYANQNLEAGELIAWFLLQNIYEAVDRGNVTLDTVVPIVPSLIAENDHGYLVQSEDLDELTVEALLHLVIEDGDISAINHLIQLVGGPNEFNLWLNQNNYFATRVTSLLDYKVDGSVGGVVTNLHDLQRLLSRLADDQLVSRSADEQIKALLLNSPLTAKFPEGGIPEVEVLKRYEIASPDTQGSKQAYSSIIETEKTSYVVLVFANKTQEEDVNTAIANIVATLVSYAETGSTNSVREEETEDEETEEVEEPTDMSATTTPPAATQPAEENVEYYQQYVSNTGEYVTLPNRGKVNENGVWVEPTWFLDEDGNYKYYFEGE